jgi:hypothetical protein
MRGVGDFILEHLEDEAAARGLNYSYNVVPDRWVQPSCEASWPRILTRTELLQVLVLSNCSGMIHIRVPCF